MDFRRLALLGLSSLAACAPARTTPKAWELRPAPVASGYSLKLAEPAWVAVYELEPGQPARRISDDLAQPTRELTLPVPAGRSQRSLNSVADVSIGVRAGGILQSMGTATEGWSSAEVVSRGGGPPLAPASTWLAIWLPERPAATVDSVVARTMGRAPELARAQVTTLSRELGTDSTNVRLFTVY